MSVARLPASGVPRRPANLGAPRPPRARAIARRRTILGAAKLLLPLVAVALLALLALWPEIDRSADSGRISYRRTNVMPESGDLAEPSYRGVDSSNRPYTITATSAHQAGQNRTDLVVPKADMTLESGNWVMLDAAKGVYLPKDGQLDLSGDVTIYRDDGMTIAADTATIDLHQGAATTADRVHVEGAFGTLDAQGMTLLDKGDIVQFAGPARLVLNGGKK